MAAVEACDAPSNSEGVAVKCSSHWLMPISSPDAGNLEQANQELRIVIKKIWKRMKQKLLDEIEELSVRLIDLLSLCVIDGSLLVNNQL